MKKGVVMVGEGGENGKQLKLKTKSKKHATQRNATQRDATQCNAMQCMLHEEPHEQQHDGNT